MTPRILLLPACAFFTLTVACGGDDTGDCTAEVAQCPDGYISCDPEALPEDCEETVVGEGECASTLYCMLGD